MPTPHNSAQKGDFAKIVLMPGDPLRAKLIADNFLIDPHLVTSVRNVYGYTGKTKSGKEISVMASGMGQPSIGIYSTELFSQYGVEAIIRIGTCGSYQKDVKVGDIILAEGACTDSNWMDEYDLKGGTFSAIADFPLLLEAYKTGVKLGKKIHVGNILAADHFYSADPDLWKKWAEMGVLGVEMESYALYCIAAKLHKKALTLLTVSDSFLGEAPMSSEQRQKNLLDMIEMAVEVASAY